MKSQIWLESHGLDSNDVLYSVQYEISRNLYQYGTRICTDLVSFLQATQCSLFTILRLH